MIDREQFISDAWKLEGKPFGHQGVDPSIGLDCIHAPAFLIRQQGVEVPFEMPRTYRQDFHYCQLIEHTLDRYLIEVSKDEAQAGDLYLFRPAISMRHLAIRLTDDSPPLLLHPTSIPQRGFPNGKITVQPFADRWLKIFRKVYRIPWGDSWQ